MASPLPVAHLSPTAQSHNRRLCQHCSARRGGPAGRIRPHKVYGIFLQPASLYASTIASALTVHTAVKFCVSPRFIAARSFEFFICSLSFLIPPCLLTRTRTPAHVHVDAHAHVHVRHTCARAHRHTCALSDQHACTSTHAHIQTTKPTRTKSNTVHKLCGIACLYNALHRKCVRCVPDSYQHRLTPPHCFITILPPSSPSPQ